MIRIEHINMVVSSIKTSLHFYQSAFPHWFIRDEGDDTWFGKDRHWLHLGDDYQYLAMSEFLSDDQQDGNRDLTSNQVGLAHFAFSLDNIKAVMSRLADAGYHPAKDGSVNPFRENIYYIDPSGFEVEFVQYFSDEPSQRNST
jgi:catechol 2,3-dioxygenase-like lactoylglutathione lyase family enzyme